MGEEEGVLCVPLGCGFVHLMPSGLASLTAAGSVVHLHGQATPTWHKVRTQGFASPYQPY